MIDIKQKMLEWITCESEGECYEFKENWDDHTLIGEYISALSNVAAFMEQDAGYLVWGVNDKTHELVGTTFDFHKNVKNEPLQHYLARQLSPSVPFQFHELDFEGKRIVVLEIQAASKVPTAFVGNRYFRISSSKVNLNKYPERESELFAVLRSGPITTENMEAFNQDLTFRKLFLYYEDKGITLNKKTFAKNLGLLTATNQYNLLAQLLSDNSQMPIRLSIFKGLDKASSLYAVREFGNNCLLLSLDKILEYGDVLNIMQADERNRIVERKEMPLFNQDAFREAVINAFVHNRWVDGNAPMITVYSNRIEILSRGKLPPKQTKDGFFQGISVPVNAKLSDVFLQLHISERSGRGVPKITSAYGENAFEFRDNSIVVTIPLNYYNAETGNNPDIAVLKLNSTRQRIVDEMRNNPNITGEQLAIMIGIGKTAIGNNISFLRKNGVIERVGSKKNGWWKVL